MNFSRSLVRLAWILQHAATLLPMAGEIQAVLNSQTAGVSDIHAWGLMLPSSSRVSPITYHSVVAVRYSDLCRILCSRWQLGSFASGGIPGRPPEYQFILCFFFCPTPLGSRQVVIHVQSHVAKNCNSQINDARSPASVGAQKCTDGELYNIRIGRNPQ